VNADPDRSSRLRHRRLAWFLLLTLLPVTLFFAAPAARTETGSTILVVSYCALLAIAGVTPVWSLPLLLIALAPLVLGGFGPAYSVVSVAQASLHPVLVVFTCGLCFALVARKYGIDTRFVNGAIRVSEGRYVVFLLIAAAATVWLSAWISNIAAAGLVCGAVAPAIPRLKLDSRQRQCLMLVLAGSANLGGMISPIGAGANAVAIAATPARITFLQWLLFATPLTVGTIILMAVASVAILRPTAGLAAAVEQPRPIAVSVKVPLIFGLTVALWVLEPWHGVDTAIVSAAALAMIFLSRTLAWRDVFDVDWSTILMVAGGIGIGYLIQQSGAADAAVGSFGLPTGDARVAMFLLCVIAAVLSAVMSNTGTAAMLIPIAMIIVPHPSTAVLIALATAFGFPLIISTPANSLAVRHGARQFHLLVAGVVAIILGSALLAWTGRLALGLAGVRQN
jgi:solute carrier family 13 (sodium-dependent dicarboxylate transporter), member 2/3/5